MAEQRQMREYETIYVLSPNLEDKTAKDFMLKMKSVVAQHGGKNVLVECVGRKRLAWLRDKHQRGIYVHHTYLGQSGIVKQFESLLDIDENVLLRQTMLVNKDVNADERLEMADKLDIPVIKERREFQSIRPYGGSGDRFQAGDDWDMDHSMDDMK